MARPFRPGYRTSWVREKRDSARRSFHPPVRYSSARYEVVMNNSTGEQRIFKGVLYRFYFIYFFILRKHNGIRDLFWTGGINNASCARERKKGKKGRGERKNEMKKKINTNTLLTGQ